MSKTKKEHYVPQSYLRRFSSDGKQIHVYDKVLKRSFSSGIRDVAQESYFYDIPRESFPPELNVSEEDLQAVEKAFNVIEGAFSQTVEDVLRLSDDTPLSPEQRGDLSVFIAIQLLRTRAYRNLVVELAEKFVTALCVDLTRENFGEEGLKFLPKVTFKDKAAGIMQSRQIFDFQQVEKMAQFLQGHIWKIGINQTSQPFYTSDNPVVMHTELKHLLPGVGIASPGIEIAFPLSSNRVLILGDREVFGLYEGSSDGLSGNLAAENVEYYNSLQVIHSERQLYCTSPMFTLAEDMIQKNPNLSTSERERVEVNILDALELPTADKDKD